jgi:hypothetical protein
MAQGRRGHRTSGSTVHRSRHDRVAIVGKSAERLTVDAEPAGTRRELGPLAWLVLEELALRDAQQSEAGVLTSAAGVRAGGRLRHLKGHGRSRRGAPHRQATGAAGDRARRCRALRTPAPHPRTSSRPASRGAGASRGAPVVAAYPNVAPSAPSDGQASGAPVPASSA